MKIVSFIDPPQREVVEKILQHCGLWKASPPRGPPDPIDMDHDLDSRFMDQPPELTFVDMDSPDDPLISTVCDLLVALSVADTCNRTLLTAIGKALKTVTKQDCQGFFRSSGINATSI